MALQIHKFGGTSVGSPERIQAVAGRLAVLRSRGHDLVIVVSAMGDTTDELLGLAARISDNPHRREMDMLLSAGERISMALLSMALNAIGCPAVSFTGSQSGIITDSGHGRARIVDIKPIRIRQELDKGRVVIVAGFQGVSPEKEVTTLGRGGSDTSAVALAIAFRAAECHIWTDVDGVMTADPLLVPQARHIRRLDFDTMLEFSSRGAGVINVRAVELGRKFQMPIVILNSLRDHSGTRVEGHSDMEQMGITGVTANDRLIEFRIGGLRLDMAGLAEFLGRLISLGLDLSGLHDDVDGSGTHGLSFLAPDLPENRRGFDQIEAMASAAGGQTQRDEDVGSVSVVTSGVIQAGPLARRIVDCLARAGVQARSLSSGTTSITLLVDRASIPTAVAALHRELVEDSAPA
ncbi:MAG: aspartate kinase [Candidatus Eisenbacteria bacterium]|nr:aspartate kinase [Candidatus Eisenbacteria bacterium]